MSPSLLRRAYWSAYLACQFPGQARYPFASAERIARDRDRRVRRMVAYAYRWVPYYRETLDRLGLTPADFRTVDDLRQLPLLSVADLQADPERLRSRQFAADRAAGALVQRLHRQPAHCLARSGGAVSECGPCRARASAVAPGGRQMAPAQPEHRLLAELGRSGAPGHPRQRPLAAHCEAAHAAPGHRGWSRCLGGGAARAASRYAQRLWLRRQPAGGLCAERRAPGGLAAVGALRRRRSLSRGAPPAQRGRRAGLFRLPGHRGLQDGFRVRAARRLSRQRRSLSPAHCGCRGPRLPARRGGRGGGVEPHHPRHGAAELSPGRPGGAARCPLPLRAAPEPHLVCAGAHATTPCTMSTVRRPRRWCCEGRSPPRPACSNTRCGRSRSTGLWCRWWSRRTAPASRPWSGSPRRRRLVWGRRCASRCALWRPSTAPPAANCALSSTRCHAHDP